MKSNEKDKTKKNTIYDELITIFEKITNYFAIEHQDFYDLLTFFEEISYELKEISSKIKIPKNINPNNPDYFNVDPFYNFHSSFLQNLKKISEKINTDVLSVLKNYKEEFEKDNKDILITLNSIIENIFAQQNNLEKAKNEYEEEKLKNKDYKNSLKNELYIKEIEKANKIYSNNEKKFIELKKLFEDNILKKNNIISNCIYIYFKTMHEDLDLIDNKNNEFKNLIKKYNSKQEKKSINEIFPDSNILNIENWGQSILDWEVLKFGGNEAESIIINKTEKKDEKKEDKNDNNIINEYYIPQIKILSNIIGIDDEYMILKSTDNKNNNFVDVTDVTEDEQKIKDNIVINNYIYGLDDVNINRKKEILLNLEDVLGKNIGNKDFYIDFCEQIIKSRGEKKTLYEFKSFSDLVYLTNLMNLIIENIKDDLLSEKLTKDYFKSYKILDKIICIGEKSVSEETYMCALLCKNKIFKNQKIWINCIKNKIINLLNELCTKEYKSKSKDTVFRPADFIQKNIKKTKIGKFIGKIGGLIDQDKSKNLIESCGFNKSIEHYSKLSKEQKKNIDNNALSIYHGVIKCYIRHITNYNFNLENAQELISLICNTLNIKDDEHNIFYCYYYQDCVHTSKKINSKNRSLISKENKEKILYIKSENKDKKIPQKYSLDINNDSAKYLIVKKVSKFLDDEDKLKLICLGKYYMKIRKNIYKSFLKKDISLKRRIHIWKAYLKCNTTLALYDYKEILKETETDFFKKDNEQSIIQIQKDMNRTYLRKKTEKSSQIIYNILISFVYSENKINYVQGINSITGFLYDLTESEEETFHLLVSIFILTQIRDIYDDEEFQVLKTFFYTIERLVYLYLPKIYSKLKDNNIEMSFFMSAYFITLNTILYPSLPGDDISFMLHLWDDFILDGWKSFFSSWLAILKYHENDIVPMENDKLINFLTNKIKDSELFKKENYHKFYELKKKFKIDEELIKNLQDEISVEAGIRKVGASTIIGDLNADGKSGEIK